MLLQLPDPITGGVCGAPVPLSDQPALREALTILVDVARKFKCVQFAVGAWVDDSCRLLLHRANREKSGALELESVEVRFKLGADGAPSSIVTPDR